MHDRFIKRPLSHSQLSSFEYDPEQWYQSYWLGVRSPANAEMMAGSRIGDLIGTDKSPIPNLTPPGVKEYEMKGVYEGITLIGFADHYCPETKVLHENKTSANKSRWTKKKVSEHPQLTMYAMLLQLQDGVEPEEVTMYLNFIPVCLTGVTYNVCQSDTWKQFETRRTKEDVQLYQIYLMDTIAKMESYAAFRDNQLSTPRRRPPVFNMVK